MAADKDYVLGVGVELQTQSIADFEQEVRRRLESIQPIKIKAIQLSDTENAALQEMLTKQQQIIEQANAKRKESNAQLLDSFKQRTVNTKAQMDEETSIINTKLNEQQSILEGSASKQADINRDVVANWESRTASVSEQLSAENAAIEEKLSTQNAILEQNAAKRKAATEAMINGSSTGATLISGSDGAWLEKQQKLLDKYIPQLNEAKSAQKGLTESVFATSDATDHLLKSMGNIATWSVGIAAVVGTGQAIAKGFSDAIHSQQEQVVQSFYYKAQGQDYTPQLSQQTMSGAIDLARKYGDDVMQVQEAIGLWAKSTKGELLPSLDMANEALKLNSVTGMSNEEIYRSTIAVLSQYHEALNRSNDIYNIGVGLAQKYGGGIKMLGGEAQDAARQMIEAMDTSSAVAASFGLTMEQSAGMATALIHAGNYDSGKSAGEAISRSLAALERGKPEVAMEKMGIAMHNNKQLLDELVTDWNKEVPGMGKSLGDVITSSVQSSALEPLKLLINQISLVKKATKDAYDYEKSHPLDQMYESMKNTDAFKLNQLKASVEAVGITIGRQFLDPLNKAMDETERAVPLIMSLAPVFGDVAKTLGLLGVGWGSIEVIKLLGGAAVTAGKQWVEFGQSVGIGNADISLSEQVAMTALTNEQKAAIATLTENATVTTEMEAEWKSLAINQGVSIDAMIAAMAKLKADTQAGAASIIVSEDSIATNMRSVAEQVGVEETQVVAAFDGMAVGAESAATSISLAMLKIIPIVGQVILAVGLAKTAYDAWQNKQHQHYNMSLQYDRDARLQDESQSLATIGSGEYELRQLREQLRTGKGPFVSTRGGIIGEHGEVSPTQTVYLGKDQLLDRMNDVQARIEAAREQYHNDKSGYTWTQYQSVDQQIAANKAGIQHALNNPPVPPGFTESGAPPVAPPTKGLTSAGTQYADQQKAIADGYQKLVKDATALDQADQIHIRTLQAQIKHTSDYAGTLDKLRQAYSHAISDRQKHITLDNEAAQHFDQLAAQTTAKANKLGGEGTTQGASLLRLAQRFSDRANDYRNASQVLQAQLQELNSAKQINVNDAIGKELLNANSPMMSRVRSASEGLASGMKLGTETLAQIKSVHDLLNQDLYIADRLVVSFHKLNDTAGEHTAQAWAQTIATALQTASTDADELTQKIQSMHDNLNDDITAGLEELKHPGDSPFATYAKGMDDLNKKFGTYMDLAKRAADPTSAEDQVSQWYAVKAAVLESTYAVQEYDAAEKRLEKTAQYAFVTALGNDIGKSLTSDVEAGWNLADQQQASALQGQITELEREKNFLQGNNSQLERMQLEQRIQKLQADAAGIKDRESHPGLFKQIYEDTQQAIMTGLTDQLTKALQSSLTKGILGPDPSNPQQIFSHAVDKFAVAIDAAFGGSAASSVASSVSQWGMLGVFGNSAAQIVNSLPTSASSNAPYSAPGGAAVNAILVGVQAASQGVGAIPSGGGGSGFGGGSGSGGGAPGGSPSGYGGSISPATLALATSAMGANGMSMSPVTAAQMGSPSAIMSGGVIAGGGSSGKKPSFLQGALGSAFDLYSAVQGYDQGGFSGSLMAGIGVGEAAISAGNALGIVAGAGSLLGPIAIGLGAIAFGASLFHPHYNPTQNPDMYKDDGYAQGVANAAGAAYTQANGWVYEDPTLKEQLGGQTQLQYLDTWYNQYPGGNGLNSTAKSLWTAIGHLTGNGKGVAVQGLHQGNVFIGDGHNNKVGESGNWQTVLTDIDNLTNQLYTLENGDNQGMGTWISVNSYGAGGGGSATFSPWYTPGMSASDVSAVTNMPYPPVNSNATVGVGVNPSPGVPSGGAGGAGGGVSPGVGPQPMSVSTAVYLNNEVLATQVNAFNIQRQNAGWAPNY